MSATVSTNSVPAHDFHGPNPGPERRLVNGCSILWCLPVLLALVSCSARQPYLQTIPQRSHFLAITNFESFSRAAGEQPGEWILTSPAFHVPFPWNELVLSWNTVPEATVGLKIEARAEGPDFETAFYNLGLWSASPQHRRESVKGQNNAFGVVRTDTLTLKRFARSAVVRVTISGAEVPSAPPLKLIGVSFVNTTTPRGRLRPHRAVWNKTLAVPERSQLSYEGGRGWCSPTCVSMVLGYWAEKLRRPELDIDVPAVAGGVHDPNWPGTGNWPFNTAFAGSFRGMRAYVVRLDSVSDLERWVDAGVPPIVSVSSGLLNGRPHRPGSGHLVVCVGFTATGDPIMNDPWARIGEGQRVRRVYKRENLEKAWQNSHGTVYLIHPENWRIPDSRLMSVQ